MDGNHNTNAGFASSKTVIDKTTFTANNSEDSCGIMQMGGLEMTNDSVIEANNNPYGGVWIEYESEISDSKVIAIIMVCYVLHLNICQVFIWQKEIYRLPIAS